MRIEKIIITGRLYKEMKDILQGKLPGQALFLPESEVTTEVLKWADAYSAFRPVDNFGFYNIKWVHCLGAGVDSFLAGPGWKEDVILTRTNASFGARISEYCLSYILMQLQKHDEFSDSKKRHEWERIVPAMLKEQNIIIYGTGMIAQEIARKLDFFGAAPVGVSAGGSPRQFFRRIVKIHEAKQLLPDMDFVINTLPLTESTKGIFNSEMFAVMKQVCFINVGRGASVDERSLIRALNEGNVNSAVLDVFENEPLPAESELWGMPNISITPHISAVTTPGEAAEEFISTLEAVEKEAFPLKNQVDIRKGY